MHRMNNDWGIQLGLGWIIGVLVFVVLILVMYRVFNKKRNLHKWYRNWPVDFLKKQYKQVELDKDEFETKK